MLDNIRNILAIDDISITNLKEKTKEADDELSTASSMTNTNFTGDKNPNVDWSQTFMGSFELSVVTFNDFSRKVKKSKAICRRSHQVTILVLVMTFLFAVGISGLVCMIEMRFQKMRGEET